MFPHKLEWHEVNPLSLLVARTSLGILRHGNEIENVVSLYQAVRTRAG